jgi:hypothetical protein
MARTIAFDDIPNGIVLSCDRTRDDSSFSNQMVPEMLFPYWIIQIDRAGDPFPV